MEGFEKEILDTVGNSFGIALNANDFFQVASSDVILLDPDDFHWAMPIIKKYGYEGQKAVMSKIAETMPLQRYISEDFKKALKEIDSQQIEVISG